MFNLKKRKIVEIPVNEVSNELFTVRESKQFQIEPSLKQSIMEDGICEPVLLMKVGKREYEVISGSRRFETAKELGFEYVPALVIQENERTAYEMSLVMKLLQNPLSLYERSVILNEILDQKIMSKAKLVTYLDISHPYLDKLLAVKHVTPTVKYALNTFQITEAECFYLLSFPSQEQEVVLERMIRDVRRDSYRDVLQLDARKTDEVSLTIAINTLQKAIELVGKSGHPFTYESEELEDEVVYTVRIQK